MDAIPEEVNVEMLVSDKNIVFYVAGFITRSMQKKFKCSGCTSIISNTDEEFMMLLVENIPSFLNSINRGGLAKPSDIVNLMCCCSGCFQVYNG